MLVIQRKKETKTSKKTPTFLVIWIISDPFTLPQNPLLPRPWSGQGCGSKVPAALAFASFRGLIFCQFGQNLPVVMVILIFQHLRSQQAGQTRWGSPQIREEILLSTCPPQAEKIGVRAPCIGASLCVLPVDVSISHCLQRSHPFTLQRSTATIGSGAFYFDLAGSKATKG